MSVPDIRTEADYEAGLERVEALMDAKLGTPEADELEILAALIERYENERFPIATPTPLAATHLSTSLAYWRVPRCAP